MLKHIWDVYLNTGELPPNFQNIYEDIAGYTSLSNVDYMVSEFGVAESFISYNVTNIKRNLDEQNLFYSLDGKMKNSPIIEVW